MTTAALRQGTPLSCAVHITLHIDGISTLVKKKLLLANQKLEIKNKLNYLGYQGHAKMINIFTHVIIFKKEGLSMERA